MHLLTAGQFQHVVLIGFKTSAEFDFQRVPQ
jgi:hypothetical protein